MWSASNYCIEVTAHNVYGEATTRACLELFHMAPADPSNFTGQLVGPTTIRVAWSDNSDNEAQVVIERVYANPEVAPANTTFYDFTLAA